MHNLNDTVMRIHMTFLNHKRSTDWIISFEDEIAPLSSEEFMQLIHMLEGIAQMEQNNQNDSMTMNAIPTHLQNRASHNYFADLIERIHIEYARWRSQK